jgi:hypothetical protein
MELLATQDYKHLYEENEIKIKDLKEAKQNISEENSTLRRLISDLAKTNLESFYK